MTGIVTRALEGFLLDVAPRHYSTSLAPNTHCGLYSWAAHNGWYAADGEGERPWLPVYDGGCGQTIYSSPQVNCAFRAWHDSLHLNLHEDFSLAGELRVWEEHRRVLQENKYRYHFTDDDIAAMRMDVEGQVRYYYVHKQYVEDQRRFVSDCLRLGLDRVLFGEEVY